MSLEVARTALMDGDSFLLCEKYEEAIKLYDHGLCDYESMDKNVKSMAANIADELKIRFLLLSHRCTAHLKKMEYERAYLGASNAMELLSNDGKVDIDEAWIDDLKKKLEEAKRKRKHEAFSDISTTEDSVFGLNDIHSMSLGPDEANKSGKEIPEQSLKAQIPKGGLPSIPKYQYYQSDTFVTISILEPNVTPSTITVEFLPQKLTVMLTKKGHTFTVICGLLFDLIDVEGCKVKYLCEKVLIKLKKKEKKIQWHELFGVNDKTDDIAIMERKDRGEKKETESSKENTSSVNPLTSNATDSKVSPYISSKDWNAIERELKKEEALEKPEGDEALNKLFQDIYGKANDDTKRAMIKSFQTSGGTVLSTNWNEVKDKEYEKERQAPKGMEWKNWEGERLEQKES